MFYLIRSRQLKGNMKAFLSFIAVASGMIQIEACAAGEPTWSLEGRMISADSCGVAVAVGLTTQCPYCIEVHRKGALDAGATEQELVETTFVAAALRAGGAVAHGSHLVNQA